MILKVVIPEKEILDLSISLPKTYLGKQVHCLFYIEEEASSSASLAAMGSKKPSDFFGILNQEEAAKFENQTKQLRNEWDNAI